MRIYCNKCGHIWKYTGKVPEDYYITCPRCRRNIKQLKVKEETIKARMES